MVPWGMTVGPDGALYVAVDRSYLPVDGNYALPPPPCESCGQLHRTGAVVRVELLQGGPGEEECAKGEAGEGRDAGREGNGGGGGGARRGKRRGGNGKLELGNRGGGLKFGAMTNFCEGFSRPSGLAFTEAGELLVASLDLQVSRFAGPLWSNPGHYLGVFYSMRGRNSTARRIQMQQDAVGLGLGAVL